MSLVEVVDWGLLWGRLVEDKGRITVEMHWWWNQWERVVSLLKELDVLS